MTRALPLILIVSAAALLRSVHLGYSHFQGDEVSALFPPDADFAEFLLRQQKGPGQFLVTRMMHGLVGGYDELMTRVPFTVASVAGVALVAAFVRSHWGPQVALLGAALMASCGLILAFGRIVQYQAFSMLLILATAWSAFTFALEGEIKWLYAAAATLGVGLLFHYDPVTFVPTFCLLVGVRLWRSTHRLRLTAHLVGAALLAIAITATFFLPYVLQPGFAQVAEYLRERVAGGGTVTDTFRSVRELLALYLPPFYFTIVGPAGVAGVIGLLRRGDLASHALLVWFASTFSFYMLLGGDPRSHVYTIFIPGLIITAYGLLQAIELADRARVGRAVRFAVWTVLMAFGWAAWMMLVDHRVEHPWYAKSLFGYRLPNLEDGKIQGVFGFPYQRGLDSVGDLFDRGELAGTFESNERVPMANYYFHSRRGDPADYYVYVHRPLSLERNMPSDVKDHYVWLRQIVVDGRKTIDLYERVP